MLASHKIKFECVRKKCYGGKTSNGTFLAIVSSTKMSIFEISSADGNLFISSKQICMLGVLIEFFFVEYLGFSCNRCKIVKKIQNSKFYFFIF